MSMGVSSSSSSSQEELSITVVGNGEMAWTLDKRLNKHRKHTSVVSGHHKNRVFWTNDALL